MHRLPMTEFYVKTKKENLYMFCDMIRKKIEDLPADSIVIVADLRHRFELNYFKKLQEEYATKGVNRLALITIRNSVTDQVRSLRGWKLSPIDSDQTEIDLDNHKGMTLYCL